MKRIILIALVAVGVVVVLGLVDQQGRPSKPLSEAQTDFSLATYTIDGKPYHLADGDTGEASSSTANPVITKYFGNEAEGDINDDGVPDVAFIITQDGGGSGTFYYAVAALKTDTGYVGTNGVFLGDRIAPQSTTIQDGVISVNYAVRAEGEPLSAAPSLGVTKHLLYEQNMLMDGMMK